MRHYREAVTDEVDGLADEMMQVVPMGCSYRSKEPHPKRIKRWLVVSADMAAVGLKRNHQNA